MSLEMHRLKGHSNSKIELRVEHVDDVKEKGSGSQVTSGRNSPARDTLGSFSLKLNSVVWKSTTNLPDNADSLRPILSGEEIRQRSSSFGNRQNVLKSKDITSNAEEWPCSFESVIYSTQSPTSARKAADSPRHFESDHEDSRTRHITRSPSTDRFRESSGTPPPRSNLCPVTTVRALREELNNRRPKSFIQLKISSTTTSEDRWRQAMNVVEGGGNERQIEEEFRLVKDLEKCRYLRGCSTKELSVEDIFR